MDIHLAKRFDIRADRSVDQRKLFSIIESELNSRGVSRDSYRLGGDPHVGFGELRLSVEDGYWVVCVDERGESFNPCIFTNHFNAVNYFMFELSGAGGEAIWNKL
jgi:hypothetical protein